MRKVILESEYDAENIENIFSDIHYEIENGTFKTDEHGLFKGTISIQLVYSDYKEKP